MGANKQICRLCLEKIPENNYEDFDDITREILEILLIDINLDINDNAIVCNKCLEKIQSCFDFKSTCFYTDDYITPFVDADTKVDIRKVFEKEVSKENVNLENYKICRLCLSVIEEGDYATDRKDMFFLEDMVVNCLPEVDLNIVLEPLICKPCLSKMESYYEFKKCCQEVEQRSKEYFGVSVSRGVDRKNAPFDLAQIKKEDTINKPLISDTEYSDVENSVDGMNRHKNEETEKIECDEIDIKDDELDVEKMMEFNCLEDISSSGKNDSSKTKRTVTKGAKKGKKQPTFFCPKCPYSSNNRSNFRTHVHTHSDDEVHRCILCSFLTDSRLSLKAHLSSHRGATKAFGCRECSFETEYKMSLTEHLKNHKDKSEANMHECPLCPYQSMYRTRLVTHQKLKHNKNMRIYKCEECSYSTKHNSGLRYHRLKHMKSEEVQMYKCAKCKYETKHKKGLIGHLVKHTDTIFKCDKCPHQSKWRHVFNRHMTVHSDVCYRCDECAFSTKHTRSLVKHKQNIHPKDGERKVYKCTLCSYQAVTNITFRNHMGTTHMDPSVPIMNCPHCPYKTSLKHSLLKHVRDRHDKRRLSSDAVVQPAQFSSLKRHTDPGQTAMYFCATCDYQTKYKNCLRGHMPKCLKTKTI